MLPADFVRIDNRTIYAIEGYLIVDEELAIKREPYFQDIYNDTSGELSYTPVY